MTEAWTHQFNSEADFLDFLKMKREFEELKKENERLKAASSPIECKNDAMQFAKDRATVLFPMGEPDANWRVCVEDFLSGYKYKSDTASTIECTWDDILKRYSEEIHLELGEVRYVIMPLLKWLKENYPLSAAALPLPVESKWSDDDWEHLYKKFIDILYEANGTGSGAEDIIEYLKSIKNQSIK
jgi:hypothetical protein